MTRVITISNGGDVVVAVKTLNRIKKRLPAMTISAMRKWGNILAKDVKVSARQAFIMDSSGKLQGNGIRWQQGPRSYVGYLFIRQYGVFLDSMKPHWVSVRNSRQGLMYWAKRAMIPNIRTRARMVEKGTMKSFGVYVKPHPFIRSGYAKARPKLKSLLRQSTARGVNL